MIAKNIDHDLYLIKHNPVKCRENDKKFTYIALING